MTNSRIESLRLALEHSPNDAGLRSLLAQQLDEAGERDEALEHYLVLFENDALTGPDLATAARVAVSCARTQDASRLIEAANRQGIEGIPPIERELEALLSERGVLRLVPKGDHPEPIESPLEVTNEAPVSFDGIGGLDEQKKLIHRMVILPRQRPDLYEKYGRRAGGGVLFFGPPGCGKTLLARATATECGVPFFNLRIEEILDPYIGVSERNLHAAFEQARANAPCVLFLDELDALAYARRKQHASGSRVLVDQLLQELDAIGSDNEGVLTLAATNAPWDVDDALKRPGRFDRVLFVPPPDAKARTAILEALLVAQRTQPIDIKSLAKRTPLFSGADLRALVERSIDAAIDEALALASGEDPPLAEHHFESALEDLRPSTLEWLSRARNYTEFANRDQRYRDVEKYLNSREARRQKF